jgi:hypothetical protein
MQDKSGAIDLFNTFKQNILNSDPVYFCENFLTLDGKPFQLNGNGYKPFADIYRYVGLKAVLPDSRGVVLVKGRQVGATTMAAALELYFMACGLYGTNNRSSMAIMHLFPTLSLAAAYTKDKLDSLISTSKPMPGIMKNNGMLKSFMETKLESSDQSGNNQHYKRFVNNNKIWIESTGLDGDRVRGRQLSLDTELPTPKGFIKLADLKEGDQLFDENGCVCNVVKLHPINLTPEAYKVTFDDGTEIEACAEHLWLTYTRRNRIQMRNKKQCEPTIKNTKELLETLKVSKESNHSIPVCKPLQFPEQKLPVDPYLFGLWLGNGDRWGRIELLDPEVLKDYPHRITKSSIGKINNWNEEPSKSISYRVFELTTGLTKIGQINNPNKHCKNKDSGFYNKHIPDIYMQSSTEQRMALLQGLMDTDGSCYKDGRCEFTQVKKDLAYQVLDLIRGLGFKATIRQKESWRYDVQYQDKYVIMFSTSIPVFRLARKLENMKANHTTRVTHRYIKNIEQIETKPMRCITVDSPSHLYLVTRAFIATHNTVDTIFYDECQDMNDVAIGTAAKILTQAKYGPKGNGVQVFFGTPKTKGGSYWKTWQNSTQNYFHLRCEKCGEYFPLYRPDVNWEDIWLYGMTVRCTQCKHEQEKNQAAENGKWIPLAKNPDSCDFVGYHINQLYIPFFTKEVIEKQKPERNPSNSERLYMNEVLGEFYDGDGSTLSVEEIHNKCADRTRAMARTISPERNKKVYVGFDWGQKAQLDQTSGRRQGKSYSCAVVLTSPAPNIFEVEFATRLMRNDPEEKMNVVEEMFRRYSVALSIGDIGDAFDLTHKLQRKYGDMFLASRSSHRINGHVKYSEDEFPKVIMFEKDYYISEMIGLLKEGRIKFPYKDYEKIDWLIKHCASMDIKITRDKTGEPMKKYIKGDGPNDGLMALLNAYLAWKFDVTQGFKIKNPSQMKYEKATQLKTVGAILGYVPGLSRG